MDTPWVYVVWGCAAYLLGSVSFGDVVARLAGARIREMGTGNPGTANVFRELGPRYSAAVFALDLVKGAAATVPAFVLDLPIWAGLAGTVGVMIGHFLPVFWKFRGGTGLVVAIGAALGLVPLGALVAAPLSAVVFLLTRDSGFFGAAFMAAAAVAGWLAHDDPVAAAIVFVAGVAVFVKSRVQYHWGEGRL